MIKAFANIASEIGNSNHSLSVIAFDTSDDIFEAKILKILERPRKSSQFVVGARRPKVSTTNAVIFIETVRSLRLFNEKAELTSNYSKPYQFFVICREATFETISSLEENNFTAAAIQFEYFIVDKGSSITLLTFVWYTSVKCGVAQLIEVNMFSKKTNRWANNNFKIDKFQNFYGCTLRFNFKEKLPSYQSVAVNLETEKILCRGFLCGMAKDISTNLNFDFKSNYASADVFYFENVESDFNWYMTSLNIVSEFYLREGTVFFFTDPFIFTDHWMAIPPGVKLSAYEKFILPFDDATWTWIAITFGTTFFTIFVLKFVKTDIRNFIVGRSQRDPVLNVFRVFFGGSQQHCPGRNFARYLLMMFILFCLIIRTTYQGKTFEFLQKDLRKPTVQSIKEMIALNYTFYLNSHFVGYFKDHEMVKR